jgi:ubiquinone/menaquinone biosynthesis C-methylase UbiE
VLNSIKIHVSGWKEFAAQKVNDRLVELAEIKPGQKVFDIVTTGIGEPAVTAARRLVDDSASRTSVIENNKGHVLVIDISSQMLIIAKQRAVSSVYIEKKEFVAVQIYKNILLLL